MDQLSLVASAQHIESSPAGALTVMNEAELAAMRAAEGATVVEHAGRFWLQTFTGFYQPIHQLAEFHAAEVSRPTWRCWGYRAALVATDRNAANGAIPVHLMSDLAAFTESAFEESRRRDLRRCRGQVEIHRVSDPDPFMQDGWTVYRSAMERVAYARPVDEATYRIRMQARAPDPRRLIMAGFVDGRLAGYLESYAVDGLLYGRELFVASDMMQTGIATGLYHETITIGAHSGAVRAFCLGPVLLERPGLGWFKKTMGFTIFQAPARIAIPAPIRTVIKVRRPAVHYRLTGHDGPTE